ncbi:MAG: clostripain-related cysteine peptidase [Firmicutes bacterium]|nr:clostripain-related cysteine peptidase [Bacillota bacterium]
MEIREWAHITPHYGKTTKTASPNKAASLQTVSDSVTITSPVSAKTKLSSTLKAGSDTKAKTTVTSDSSRKTEASGSTQERKELTVLFYLNGEYKDIGDSVAAALPTLGKKGTDSKINILAQLGYKPGKLASNKNGAKYDVQRYVISKHIQTGDNFIISGQENIKREFACDQVESFSPNQSITDPKMLESFVEWGVKNYPADKYMIVFAGHGKAWKGALEFSPAVMKEAVTNGVNKANSETGRKDSIDLAVFNTCLNASLETLYDMKDMAKFTIASEDIAWGGIEKKWDSLLNIASQQIDKNGSFNAKKFSGEVVKYFRDIAAEGKKEEPHIPGEDNMDYLKRKLTRLENLENYITLSAVDNSRISEVVEAFGNFTEILKKENIPAEKLFAAANNSTNFSQFRGSEFENANFTTGIRDLGDLMNNIENAPWCSAELKDCCRNIKDKLQKSLIREMHLGEENDRYSGININMPSNAGVIDSVNKEYTEKTPDFNRQTGWNSFLTESARSTSQKAREKFAELGGARLPEDISEDSKEARELRKLMPQLDLSK